MEKVKLGVVGLGGRGFGMVGTFLNVEDCEIVAVCDKYPDRVERAEKLITEKSGKAPKTFTSFEEFINYEGMEAVYIATSWEEHLVQAIESMKAGKITAVEVGGAQSVKECFDLVKTYEKTKTPIMLMENCCYDKFELLTTALVRKGMLGEIVNCHGAYGHDLRAEVLGGNVNRHYRLNHYINENCENYPTHELGPIAKILDINRGNRMVSLVSVASKSRGMQAFSKTDKNPDKNLTNQEFKQGDIVETIITCENGETISLKLDTSLPRYYSREFTVNGTLGRANGEANLIYLDSVDYGPELWHSGEAIAKYNNNAEDYNEYLPSFWKDITEEEKKLGHGGMDYFLCKNFIKAVKDGVKEMPIDVYDAAAWMCITALSAKSIKKNGKPVKIPDFTKGKYKTRKSEDVVEL